jgi:hypothetical protein
LAGNWSIGIRRLGKFAQESALRPRYAARMEGQMLPDKRSSVTLQCTYPERG